jgi:cytoskeletal protein CcmA (bactofilin family)
MWCAATGSGAFIICPDNFSLLEVTVFRKKKEEIEVTPTTTTRAETTRAEPSQPHVASHTPVVESAEEVIARRFGKPRSALGPGTVIQGKLSFDTIVVIEGKLGGEVYSTETLIVGKQGTVSAQVRVKSLVVAGVVKGDIVAADSIELLRGGRIEGDFTAKRVIMEEGAVFNGSCRMKTDSSQPLASKVEEKVSPVAKQATAPKVTTETNPTIKTTPPSGSSSAGARLGNSAESNVSTQSAAKVKGAVESPTLA